MNPDTTHRIVCGVDSSASATDVIAVASEIADAIGLRLTLVHSAYPDVFLTGEQRRAALRHGEALLERLAPDVPAADRVVEIGDPADLLRAVLEDGAALGVVGSRGRGAASAAFLGSVSHALTRTAPCPVVIVPPRATLKAAAGAAVVCGVDGSAEAMAGLEAGGALAAALGGRLVAVYVRPLIVATAIPLSGTTVDRWDVPVEDGRAALAIVERALAHLDVHVPVTLCVESGDPAERLAAVARQQSCAILAVGSRSRGDVTAALLGSVSARLGKIAPAPVMVSTRAARVPDLVARLRPKRSRVADRRTRPGSGRTQRRFGARVRAIKPGRP
jgi:nucleotide-binding universal stress UspA family protein